MKTNTHVCRHMHTPHTPHTTCPPYRYKFPFPGLNHRKDTFLKKQGQQDLSMRKILAGLKSSSHLKNQLSISILHWCRCIIKTALYLSTMHYRLKGMFTFIILLKPLSTQGSGYYCLEFAGEERTTQKGGRLCDQEVRAQYSLLSASQACEYFCALMWGQGWKKARLIV